MAGGSKRSHTKSRRGCSQCKKKRIKCDETPPRCGSCAKHGLVCDYSQWTFLSEQQPQIIRPERTVRVAGGPGKAPTRLQSCELNIEHLMLMHRYTSRTYSSLCRSASESQRQFWQSEIPLLAQTYPFLMYSVLAISALHAASEQEYDQKAAIEHYNNALRCFRTSYPIFRPEDATAVVGFCFLNFIISVAVSSQSEITVSDPIGGFLEPVGILRSTITFFQSIRSQIGGEPLEDLVPEKSHNRLSLSEDTSAALQILERYNQALVTSEGDREVCEETISSLRRYFTMVSPRPRHRIFLIRWLMIVPESFFTLLRQNNAMALVILAHWCVPVHHAPRRWYMNNWAERMVHDIANRLEPSWEPLIAWPLKGITEIPLES